MGEVAAAGGDGADAAPAAAAVAGGAAAGTGTTAAAAPAAPAVRGRGAAPPRVRDVRDVPTKGFFYLHDDRGAPASAGGFPARGGRGAWARRIFVGYSSDICFE